MSPRMTDLGTRKFVRLLLPFVICLVVGVFGRAFYPHDWPAFNIADAFFEACAIAGLIGLVIELFSAKRLIEHAGEELAGRLIGFGLPRELQELMSQTLKTGLVMKEVVKTYRFIDRPDGDLDVEMSHSYQVVNYGEEVIDYSPHLSEEKVYEPRFLRLAYGLTGNEHSHDALSLQQIARVGKNGRAIVVDAPQSVRLQPVRSNPLAPQSCRVFWQWVVRMPREYSDIIAFGSPAIGIMVRCDGGPTDLEFIVGGPGVTQGADGSRNWVTKNAFLASQHLRVWWRSSVQQNGRNS